ncbi:general transcription factor 3C polypeptide 3 [Iris pallida]|uniref:General transcription factor 3C polypeptide 3 n=1 Tax=Iris pallida TaxID=29817 RepID=A0AAX6GHH3_IRIPA|nr:general transcription factor 3C polypeptide 3 [Iris pallida]
MELEEEEEFSQYEEEEEEDEEGEEEGEGEGEESYDVDLYGEQNPLDFLKEPQGELYRRLERLEEEALAEKKRKALPQPSARDGPGKNPRQENILGATMEEIDELMNFGSRRRSRRRKKKGRKRGSKSNLTPEATRKLGDATLLYASGSYDEAIPLLQEVIVLSPCSDAFHLLGLIYDDMGDKKKALNFHMLAAHLTPKDSSLWRKLVAWSIEEKNTGQLRYCLSKAISADPEDVRLRFDLALLHFELGEYQKAALVYNQIVGLYPKNIEARKMAAKMYQKCGQVEKAIGILEDFVNDHSSPCDPTVVDQLISLQMENNAHAKALQQIEQACLVGSSGDIMPLYLKAKAAMCHAHLGNVENTEVLLKDMQMEKAGDNLDLITEVGDTFSNLGHYGYALKFYFMLEKIAGHDIGAIHLRIAHCYHSMKEAGKAIPFFYKALSTMEDNINVRITLSSLLLKEGRDADAINLFSAPESLEPVSDLKFTEPRPWWLSVNVKLELAKIYRAKGMLENFVDVIFPHVHESLVVEAHNRKLKARKRLSTRDLYERAKLLEGQQDDNIFNTRRSVLSASDVVKAKRAKKSLEKKAASRNEKKAAALAAGMDLPIGDSEDEDPQTELKEPPLPGLLKDEEHCQLVLDLCNALISLQHYLKALEIINLTLSSANKNFSVERKEEFRSLGGRIAYSTKDPKHGYDYVKYLVQQQPYSIAAWNCFYNVISSNSLNRVQKNYSKFLHRSQMTLEGCVPPILISGHQFTLISQHQAAAKDYLQAYRLQPENPLVNLCVGTALINLALGFRLQNKNQCVVQGFAFLYNYLRICDNSQEALYNVARAYHHVGLITLAATYYEKVLSKQEKDCPLPKLPYEDSSVPESQTPGYCNLHREAAHNLHLIYKKSGAVDLARQILKKYCTP